MNGIFLDSSVLDRKPLNEEWKHDIKMEKIKFLFPEGFATLRLIEECRALNCLDVSDPDNFDFMYDITIQMLTGKPCKVIFKDNNEEVVIGEFVVTDRYMNLRSIDIIDEYPVLVNWLVEFVAGELSKKYPHSLNKIRSKMSARKEERMKKL